MKNLIEQKTKELMDLVCDSEDYREYHANLDLIRRDRDLYEKLNEFRHLSMMANFLEDPDQRSGEIDRLYDVYESVLIDPLAAGFLSSEQKVCRMMREIYEGIADRIDLDLTHLGEDEKAGL